MKAFVNFQDATPIQSQYELLPHLQLAFSARFQ